MTVIQGILLATFLSVAGDDLLESAQQAAKQGKWDDALALTAKLVKQEPKNRAAYLLRAQINETTGKFADAVVDLSKVIELGPKDARLYQQRGSVAFKAGKIADSIADFDRYIELVPDAKISHWQRGISYYYAGRWDDGIAQFEGYQDFDSNDVENAVWRFMCMARKQSIPKAQAAMLKIGPDKRVPMRDVYELYVGNKKPDDVFTSARSGDPGKEQLSRQLFYAHLYVGIWHELAGDKKKALEHLHKATEDHRIGHYMWDVARVHRDILRRELTKP